MFGFGQNQGGWLQGQAPWAGLPTAPAPWNPAENAPWRMTPWQTQGMPAGQGVQQHQIPGMMGGMIPGMMGGLIPGMPSQTPQPPQTPQTPQMPQRPPMPQQNYLLPHGTSASGLNGLLGGQSSGPARAMNADYLRSVPGASPYHQNDSPEYSRLSRIDPRQYQEGILSGRPFSLSDFQ